MSNEVNYTFIHLADGEEHPVFPTRKYIELKVSFDDSEQWTAVADEFFNFLSSIYGYRCSPEKYAAQFGRQAERPYNFSDPEE